MGWQVWVVVYNCKGKCELTYAYDLGIYINNKGEALDLCQGLEILKSMVVK
jgi:hypothetical protein